jgi:hypothetical protein
MEGHDPRCLSIWCSEPRTAGEGYYLQAAKSPGRCRVGRIQSFNAGGVAACSSTLRALARAFMITIAPLPQRIAEVKSAFAFCSDCHRKGFAGWDARNRTTVSGSSFHDTYGYMYALDVRTGALLWKYQTAGGSTPHRRWRITLFILAQTT